MPEAHKRFNGARWAKALFFNFDAFALARRFETKREFITIYISGAIRTDALLFEVFFIRQFILRF
jgi:hypothetical protein